MVLITDSVCLKVLTTDSILVGIGNELHLYFVNNVGETERTIFPHKLHDKIHGIYAVKYSENVFKVVIYGGREFVILIICNNKFQLKQTSRINDWIQTIILYKLSDDLCLVTSHSVALHIKWFNETIEIIEQISCKDKSTLYTSLAIGAKWHDTIVFGGTALGELIIWSVNSEKNGQVLHRLHGHNGVIFSIDVNVEYNLLITTSDDRSIKLWHVNFYDEFAKRWDQCDIKSIKSMFGHTARVFCGKIIVEDGQPLLISIGEDSLICLWTTKGALLHRYNILNRGTLWSCDYDAKTKTIFTSSSDGNIDQCCINRFLQFQPIDEIENISIEMRPHEYMAKIKILHNSHLVCLSNEGKLLIKNNDARWISLPEMINYKSTLLECYANKIATAGNKIVSIFSYNETAQTIDLILQETLMENMIKSLKFVSETELIICDDRGNCTLLDMITMKRASFRIANGKEKWITIAVKRNKNLLISDRAGNFHLFVIDNERIQLKHTLRNVHGSLGCTNLYPVSEWTYLTSGHDGWLKFIELNDNEKTISIKFSRKIPIHWVDKIIPNNTDGNHYFAGFNDNHFVLCTTERTIVELECGGGHRYWDIIIDQIKSSGTFYFIRNRQIHKIHFPLNTIENRLRIPLRKWHTKSCNILQSIRLESDGDFLIVSGGDDNILKFYFLSLNGNLNKTTFKHIEDYFLHVSSIKSILFQCLDGKTIRIFSVGGRAQICVSQIHINKDDFSVQEVTSFMLKSSDFDRHRLGKANTIDFDPETRFMSLTMESADDDQLVLYLGCSDGFIRQFSYDNGQFKLLHLIFYGRCILHVHVIKEFRILLTMATDGIVSFWNLDQFNSTGKPFHQIQHHDSGINTFDVMFLKSYVYVATGGDDQSIVLSKFRLNKDNQLSDLNTKVFNEQHTAQVNGLQFSPDDFCLYSASVDQTIFKIDLTTFEAIKVSTFCVADMKGMTIISKKYNQNVLVYGCGIQLLNI